MVAVTICSDFGAQENKWQIYIYEIHTYMKLRLCNLLKFKYSHWQIRDKTRFSWPARYFNESCYLLSAFTFYPTYVENLFQRKIIKIYVKIYTVKQRVLRVKFVHLKEDSEFSLETQCCIFHPKLCGLFFCLWEFHKQHVKSSQTFEVCFSISMWNMPKAATGAKGNSGNHETCWPVSSLLYLILSPRRGNHLSCICIWLELLRTKTPR